MIRIVIETGPQGFSINGNMNQQQVTPVPANVLAELNSRK
jgi:hypothetical protein